MIFPNVKNCIVLDFFKSKGLICRSCAFSLTMPHLREILFLCQHEMMMMQWVERPTRIIVHCEKLVDSYGEHVFWTLNLNNHGVCQ